MAQFAIVSSDPPIREATVTSHSRYRGLRRIFLKRMFPSPPNPGSLQDAPQ
jgi:hypothetical protein